MSKLNLTQKEKSLVDLTTAEDEAQPILKSGHKSMYASHSSNQTLGVTAALIINVALLLYSHLSTSAVMISSICPQSIPSCATPPLPPVLGTDLCKNNTNDAAILVPPNEAFTGVSDYLERFGRSCISPPKDLPEGVGCVQFKVNQTFGLSLECASCFEEEVECSKQNCALLCLQGTSPACVECSNEFCIPRFIECTGVPGLVTDPPTTSFLLADDSNDFFLPEGCIDKEKAELFVVFNLTFVNSVEQAWNGGAEPLAVLVVVASGIWPYLKNVLMCFCWFKDMSNQRREYILRALAVLGKWSFVDVFAIVLIMNGVRIDKILSSDSEGFTSLIVFAESRLAIYAFGIAAIWALVEGEYIRYLSRKFALKSHPKLLTAEVKNEGSEEPSKEAQELKEEVKEVKKLAEFGNLLLDTLTEAEMLRVRRIRIALGVFAALAAALGLAGTILISLEFHLSGLVTSFEGPDSFAYSTYDNAFGIIDSCAIYKGHKSVPGTFFLAILFLLMCALIPLLTYVLLFITALVFKIDPTKPTQRNHFLSFVLGLSNFAAMDVFFLSMVSLVEQFQGLIRSAVGKSIDEECGVDPNDPSQFCLKFKGELKSGAFIILASCVCFWCAQACMTALVTAQEKRKIIY